VDSKRSRTVSKRATPLNRKSSHRRAWPHATSSPYPASRHRDEAFKAIPVILLEQQASTAHLLVIEYPPLCSRTAVLSAIIAANYVRWHHPSWACFLDSGVSTLPSTLSPPAWERSLRTPRCTSRELDRCCWHEGSVRR